MNEQLERIKNKIGQLKKLDKNYNLFGSQKHRYRFNPALPTEQIRQFELTHNVTLPSDYVAFLTLIGNGGAGSFYGLEPLENSLFDDLDYKRPESLLNPSKPFLHTQPWNLDFKPTVQEDEEEYEKQLEDFQEKYYDNEHMSGVIAICNYGCGISLNLIVNGREYGNIWTDDRGSDNGIHPSHELGNKDRISFLNWYELWLDNSLNEIEGKLLSPDKQPKSGQIDKQDKKPWWKLFAFVGIQLLTIIWI